MLRKVVLPELENSPLYDNTEIFGSIITVYEYENSLNTAFRSGSDGVVQLAGPPIM
jgi:hypothetical protein